MPGNFRILLYCTLSFILGCTLTISIVKYDECSDGLMAQIKLPREMSNFIPKRNNPSEQQFRKTISSFLIVAIMSSPNNIRQRNAIRETWGLYNHTDTQYFFFIGSKKLSSEQTALLVKEYENNKDLVLLGEAVDSYEGLTTKLLLSLSWLSNIADFSFMLKCDDDSFVRIPFILKELKDIVRNKSSKRIYWGYFDGRAHVYHVGKWAEPNWILCDRYLPYAVGGGYVLSKELVEMLSDRASFLEIYRNEDVAVGAWLATVKGLERKHDPRFDTEAVSRGCNENYIVTHKVSPSKMKKLFISINATGKLCPSGEFRVRKSYVYNWKVPPSQCCLRNDTSVP